MKTTYLRNNLLSVIYIDYYYMYLQGQSMSNAAEAAKFRAGKRKVFLSCLLQSLSFSEELTTL